MQRGPHIAADFDGLLQKDFFLHTEYESEQGDNDENAVKDANTESKPESHHHDISDETDSDIDSIKCVYCSEPHNAHGGHKCQVTCTIEHNQLQTSSSTETLVATDVPSSQPPPLPNNDMYTPPPVQVPCVLCDEKYSDNDLYVLHLNKCTANVKLHHYVCPICHEIFTQKLAYMQHVKVYHFINADRSAPDSSYLDCVDSFGPLIEKTSKPKSVRRQIGWSVEDIYQEIECKSVEEKFVTPNSSPMKTFFSKLGNE